MRKCSADVNHIRLHGAVGEAPVYSHLNHGVEFYTFPLVVRRLSGAEDQVNVVAPLELLERCGPLERESELTVLGEVRTFNNRTGVGSRLVISAFARELRGMGYQEARIVDTAKEAFGSRRRAGMMMLGDSRMLVGRK